MCQDASLAVKFLVALTCFTAVYLTTEAADTCPASLDCQEGTAEMDSRDVMVLQDPQGHQDVMEEMEQQDVMVLQDPQDRLGHQ